MKTLPYVVFCFLMCCALCAGMSSYCRTESRITQDVNRALKQVLTTMPDDVVTADTIRCYRNCLTIAALKDTAGIAMRTVRKDGRWETKLVAESNCGFAGPYSGCPTRGLPLQFCWLECCGYWAACGTRKEASRSWRRRVARMEASYFMTDGSSRFRVSRYTLPPCSIPCSKCL